MSKQINRQLRRTRIKKKKYTDEEEKQYVEKIRKLRKKKTMIANKSRKRNDGRYVK